MATNLSVLDLEIKNSANDNDTIVMAINGTVSRMKLSTFKNIIKQWNDILNKPFENIDSNDFEVRDDILSLSSTVANNLHAHQNKTYLDKIGQTNTGEMTYDGEVIASDWDNIRDKPFETLSDDFVVADGELSIDGSLFNTDWNDVNNKPFDDIDSNDFEVREGVVSISTDITSQLHSHSNKSVLDKFSESEGNLLYDGSEIGGGLDFTELSRAMTTGALTGLTITADTTNNNFDIIVTGMPDIAINASGYWTVDGVSTGQKAQGNDGATPTINASDKHWYINGVDTNVVAEGHDGNDGQNGITPSIDSTSKHWMIGSTDTNINAEGQDGYSPTVSFTNITGGRTMSVVTGSGTVTTDIMDGVTSLSTDKVDLSCTLLASGWSNSVPYTQTVSVNGITASLNPRLDVSISSTVETGIAEETAWGYITKATTATNSITFYCYQNKPTVDLNVMIEVV